MASSITGVAWRYRDNQYGDIRVQVDNAVLTYDELERFVRRFAAVVPGALQFEDTRQEGSPEAFRVLYRGMPLVNGHSLDSQLSAINQAMHNLPPDPVVMITKHTNEASIALVGFAYPASAFDANRLIALPEVHVVKLADTPAYSGKVLQLFVPTGLNQELEGKIRDTLRLY